MLLHLLQVILFAAHKAARAAFFLPGAGDSGSSSFLHDGYQVIVASVVLQARASGLLACEMEASHRHDHPLMRRLSRITLRALLIYTLDDAIGRHDRARVHIDALVGGSLVRRSLHSV